ncbi:SUMF1/EgtB/PvdO family nonheme iron enzyme [bacterium]|nr:SUMF1/EgtB/PvdO family nonheme iron enzyme [bacterium]
MHHRSCRTTAIGILAFMLMLVFSSSSPAAAAGSGDLSGDARLTTTDLDMLRDYLRGRITLTTTQKTNADINGDSKVDVADAVKMVNRLFGSITVDVTPDNATWILLGPPEFPAVTRTGDRLGADAIDNAPAGSYTLICNDLAGYVTPRNQQKVLSPYGSLNFSAKWIVPVKPGVSSLSINNGQSVTSIRTVNLNNTCTGEPTQYMASESSSFSGASWQTWSAAPSFLLSSGNGTKTLYFKVKNGFGLVSDPKSDTIQFDESEIDMVNVTTGEETFIMGPGYNGDDQKYARSNELPLHGVMLSSYRIGKFEVTNGQYAAVLNWAKKKGYLKNTYGLDYDGGHVCANQKALLWIGDDNCQIYYSGGVFACKTREGVNGVKYSMENHPVMAVTWYGCVAFCNWLSQKEGLDSCYDLSTWSLKLPYRNGYRLPTEAEWERAAGWDGQGYKHWAYGFKSDTWTEKSRANCGGESGSYTNPLGFKDFPNQPYTSPVGWFNGVNVSPNGNVQTINSPSPAGCYDMSGNVWEWCHDWYGDYSSNVQTNPTGPATGVRRVIRGGGWGHKWYFSRSAYRYDLDIPPGGAYHQLGFRVARTP